MNGWAKADAVPFKNGRYFAIDLGFKNTDGTITYIPVNFNLDSNDWQYLSAKAIPNKDYNSIIFYLLYYNQANNAYFDGLQLYKEEFSSSYQYDSNGNIISTVDLANQNSTFAYNTANDLIKATDAKGNSFNYTYDTKHNILSAASAENVVYSFTYDSYGNPLTSKVGETTLFINSSAAYTSNGNYIKTLTDSFGKSITYNYNETKGTLSSLVDVKGDTTTYAYDSNLDILTSVSNTVDGQAVKSSYTYLNDRINTITHNGFSYTFDYDSLGNNTSVNVGGQNLITNTYESRTGKLLEATYGNGQKIGYDYDNLDRITAFKYNGIIRYKYSFDASGNIGYEEDLVNGVSYRYIYDLADRLTKVVDSKNNILSFEYDKNNNNSKIIDKVWGSTYSTSYEFDKDNRPSKAILNNGKYVTYQYDALSRMTSKVLNLEDTTYTTSFNFTPGANGSTSNRIQSMTNNGSTISYTYDDNGNIETISENGKLIKYYYNELNELIREDNQVLGKTIAYAYDGGGNILSKKEYSYTTGTLGTPAKTISYGYDTIWRDKLTSYDGKTLEYDGIGNLTSYNGYKYTWEEGRQLKTISGNGVNLEFKYNSSGIRTEKKNLSTGITTTYHLVGDKITYEENGSDKIYYSYDSTGNLISMNLNGTGYYYIRNAQGDITGLIDASKNLVVTYSYDSWGNPISGGSLGNTVGAKNPYRYRGYRYDSETGLFYVGSRYYDPVTCRMLNADDTDVLDGGNDHMLENNLFAYCFNNPVNMSDKDGQWPKWATKVAIGVGVIALCAVVTVATGGAGAGVAGFIAAGALKGAIIGAATGVAIGSGMGAVSHRVSTGSWKGGGNAALNGAADGFMTGAISGAITGGAGRATKALRNTKVTGSLGKTGKPMSSQSLVKNGKVTNTRFYNAKGKAIFQLDYTNHGYPKYHSIPHGHSINFSNPKTWSNPINNLWKSRW